jgi:ABC-2 type transport system ATP-binding protein
MLQRTGIAQALVHDPTVVFLDEPMSGLDPIGRKGIRDLILRLRSEGKTVFMNTHILSDVEMVCDRVAIIVRGEISYAGATEAFHAGGARHSDVVMSRLDADLAATLEDRFDAKLRGHGERIEMRVAEKSLNEVLQLVLSAGADVVSVTPHRVSLESIFMTAVEGGIQGTPR